MSDFLKGNYSVPNKKTTAKAKPGKKKETQETTQEEFERRAMERLGGSIAFIAKSSLVWSGEDSDESRETTP